MKTPYICFLLLSALLLGCKRVEFTNGRLPAEVLSFARPYEGLYQGRFEGYRAVVKFEIRGDKPVLSYRDGSGDDLLRSQCNSQIGDLLAVTLNAATTDAVIGSAEFAFNPGVCGDEVKAKTIRVSFMKSKMGPLLKIYLLEREENSILKYRTGRFTKVIERLD